MPTATIIVQPVDPDELIIKQGTDFVYAAKVTHSIRCIGGQSIKTLANDYLGTLGSS